MKDTAGVDSCDWGSRRVVDASYSYWGNPSGPGGGSSGSPSVCGAVWTSPFYTSSAETSTNSTSSFSANCDGSQTPDQQVASADQVESDELSTLQLECETEQSACQQIQADNSCLSGLIQVGDQASLFSFGGASDVVSGGEEFLAEMRPNR